MQLAQPVKWTCERWKGSLRLRLTLSLGAVVLLITGLAVGTMIVQHDHTLRRAAVDKARAVGRTLGAMGTAAMFDNLFRLQQSIQQVQPDDTLLDIDIVDSDDLIVAAKHPDRIGLTLTDAEWREARERKAEVVNEIRTADGIPTLVIVEPLFDRQEVTAWVRMVVSLAHAEQERRRTTWYLLFFTLALMALGIYAIHLAFRRISTALQGIVTLLRAPTDALRPGMESGNIVPSPVAPAVHSVRTGHDEFESAVDAAMRLTRMLSEKSEALREQALSLEETVTERTAELEKARQQALDSLGALRDKEERLRCLVETAIDGIIVMNSQGLVESVNPAVTRMLAYTEQELVGRHINGLMALSVKGEQPRQVFRNGDRGVPQVYGTGIEVIGYRKDGGTLAIEFSISEMVLGGAAHYTAIVRDISERKQAEEARSRSEQKIRRMTEEREQLYQEVHDGMLQSLYAVGMSLEASKVLLMRNPRSASQQLDRAMSQLLGVVQELRDFMPRLLPSAVPQDGFEATLSSLVNANGPWPSTPFKVKVDPASSSLLSKEQEMHLLYIAREALTNSLRHARAKSGIIQLSPWKGAIRLEVRDDGVGFEPSKVAGSGMGLSHMASHASKIGGRLNIQSTLGQGTRVILDIPPKKIHLDE